MLLPVWRWIPPLWPGTASHSLAVSGNAVAQSVLGLDPAANTVPVAAGGLWDLNMYSTSPPKLRLPQGLPTLHRS